MDDPINPEDDVRARVLRVIASDKLRSFEQGIKEVWQQYVAHQNLGLLISNLDEVFIDQQLYHDLKEEEEIDPLGIIKQEEIQLVCYQWFKPE